MLAIIHYVLLSAKRDWLFLSLFFAVIIAAIFAIFIGSTALSEQSYMQISFLATGVRVSLVAGMVLFICFQVRRSFDNREIEFILSHSISREQFVFAYFLALLILILLLLIPVFFLLYLFFSVGFASLFLWIISFFLELIIISVFALLSSLILSGAVSAVLASFSFYLVARLMGFATAYITLPNKLENYDLISFMELILSGFAALMPRLDLFSKSKWLVYGDVNFIDFKIILLQSVIYIPLLLIMTIIDFRKKEF